MQDVLSRISENCLRGEDVPEDLRRIWDAKLTDRADLFDDLECELIHEVSDEMLEGYINEDVEPAAQRAFQRMFEHIRFFAINRDGGLLGYWVGPNLNELDNAPVVQLDSEGQFEFVGSNFAEYILGSNEDKFEETKKWLADLGISVTIKDTKDYWQKIEDLKESEGDPNDLSWSYQEEEQDNGFGADEDDGDLDDSEDEM